MAKRLFKGTYPDPEFYRFAGKHGDWKVYVALAGNEESFFDVKVISVVPRTKANYYMSYNPKFKRFVKSRNRESLEKELKEEMQDIEEILEKWFEGGRGDNRNG